MGKQLSIRSLALSVKSQA